MDFRFDEFQRDGFASRVTRACRGRGSGFAPEDHRRDVGRDFVHQSAPQKLKVECTTTLHHQMLDSLKFKRLHHRLQIDALTGMHEDLRAG